MKIVKFAEELVPLILSGEKISTWRLFDDKNLSLGDELEFVNKDTGEIFGYANIIKVKEKRLNEIIEDDYSGHERFDSLEDMLRVFRKYYGEKVDEKTAVKIIEFKLLN